MSSTRAEPARNFSRPAITSSNTSQSKRIFTRTFWRSAFPGDPIYSARATRLCLSNVRKMVCHCERDCVRQEKIPRPAGKCWFFSSGQAGGQRKAIPCSKADGCVARSCPQTNNRGLLCQEPLLSLIHISEPTRQAEI